MSGRCHRTVNLLYLDFLYVAGACHENAPHLKLYISQLYIWMWQNLEIVQFTILYVAYFLNFETSQTKHTFLRIKPPWQAISGVLPKSRKMRSAILSRMVRCAGHEASRRADSRRNHLVTKRTIWPTTFYVCHGIFV